MIRKLSIIGALILALVMLIHTMRIWKRGEDRFKRFDGTDIRGIVEQVKADKSGSHFLLHGESEEYFFWPFGYQNVVFHKICSPGDSISKNAFSDTLYLYKNRTSQIHTFTFQRTK